MNNFFQNIFEFFFIAGYVLLFIISIIILRPFRIHKKRRNTTISLKLSYLMYLAVFLVFTYLLLFGTKEFDSDNIAFDTLFNIHFIFFLTATIIPNVGIMIRKKIKKNRVEYNLMFTIVNLLYFTYLMFLIISKKWALL